MSIANEISRLITLRNNIRTKLIVLGVISDSSADLEDCYTGINGITARSSSDLSTSAGTVSVPAGYYASSESATITAGSATTPVTTITSEPTISWDANGLITATNSTSQSVTPTVEPGYISSGTAGFVTVNGTKTRQLPTLDHTTYMPGTTNQAIVSGVYLIGAQTIYGDANLIPENIKAGVPIFNVTGTYGVSPLETYINVIFPTGSICTCTKGDIVLEAPNTAGVVCFAIPETGTWHLYCGEERLENYQDITVEAGKVYNANLEYGLTRRYLADRLEEYTDDITTSIHEWGFAYRSALKNVTFSIATSVANSALRNCTGLETATFNADNISFGTYVFHTCGRLNALIMTGNSVNTINSSEMLIGTKIYYGEGGIYVPSELVSSYKAASNWSLFANNIYALEDYPVTNFETISDSWETIFANEANGTYSSKYAVGDLKRLEYDGQFIYAQIIALDTDVLAAGGTAKITWMLNPIVEMHRMGVVTSNTTPVWADSEMRSYLRETCFYKLPELIRNNIKEVTKTYYNYSMSQTASTTDTVWIPSYREMHPGGTVNYMESSGIDYSARFGTAQSDTKKIKGLIDSGAPTAYWLRTQSGPFTFSTVNSSGQVQNGSTADRDNVAGIVLGFCT